MDGVWCFRPSWYYFPLQREIKITTWKCLLTGKIILLEETHFFPDYPSSRLSSSLQNLFLFFAWLSQSNFPDSHAKGNFNKILTFSIRKPLLNVSFFSVFDQSAKLAQCTFRLLWVLLRKRHVCFIHSLHVMWGYSKYVISEWTTSKPCWAFVFIWDVSSTKASITLSTSFLFIAM